MRVPHTEDKSCSQMSKMVEARIMDELSETPVTSRRVTVTKELLKGARSGAVRFVR